MKKLRIVGISILTVGCFFLILTGIEVIESHETMERLVKACSNPGSSCPVVDSWPSSPFGIIGLILFPLGVYVFTTSQTRN